MLKKNDRDKLNFLLKLTRTFPSRSDMHFKIKSVVSIVFETIKHNAILKTGATENGDVIKYIYA